MLIIDKYAYTNSLSEKNPYLKTTFSILLLILSMIIENISFEITIIILMSLIILLTSKMCISEYLKLISIPFIFMVMSIIAIIVNISTDTNDMIKYITFTNIYIGISKTGVLSSIKIFSRSLACLSSVYFLILTTPFNQLILVLKKLHIPDNIIEISMLIYRFIFIFLEEVSEIHKSQEIRLGYMGIRNSYNSLGLLINMLYKRMIKRYEDMSISLDMKLFNGKFYI
ncbi:cobalt ECF transporter T component CbiQ [Peptacetobacter sp.]|uniref:cobalt ECF transporter T component CbiQ n=1 Tax=Peptacetobacter sp. TaxID=2991975 RepID=UPI0026182C35|nr:cobalt ECF transporter T component CbiQ [Peptacetobacter sp.]